MDISKLTPFYNRRSGRSILLPLLVLLFISAACPVQAQLTIRSIGILDKNKVAIDSTGAAAFGDLIVLRVHGVDSQLLDLSKAMIYVEGTKLPCYKVSLYVPPSTGPVSAPAAAKPDSTPMAKVPPVDIFLMFRLTKDSAKLWDSWYGFFQNPFPVQIDIGTSEKALTINTSHLLPVSPYPYILMTIAWVLTGIFLVLSLVLAFRKGNLLLKDASGQKDDACKPYSLARFQLYWWSLIVICCYIFLYGIRDDLAIMNTTALMLLGISATATGFSFIIDYSDSSKDRHQDDATEGFWTDIISDANGISIHRYQNLVFTLLFGVIFVYKVFTTGRMPDFGQTELFLMGLSSAAYIALKAGENKNPVPPVGGGPAGH